MPALLVLAFLIVPIVELYVILQVGDVLGVVPTVLLLLAVSVLGAWLVRREGTKAWRQFREALRAGRAPTKEVIDGALVVFGGALLLTPGFATDIVGLLLIVPATRAVANRMVRSRVRTTVLGGLGVGSSSRRVSGSRRSAAAPRPGPGGPAQGDAVGGSRQVVDAEVVEVRRNDDR